ncbi:hypothetical protein GCM10017655_17210 [Pseudomonas turukhanskensis]|uniref:Uncharacterized protein n=1 Tax=Pseudomonas turukhanskensis TaxID=1806536 RepID=A0A9W6NEG4_9PSED|nr:hypothetical protein GCM10017655_17210 [Pseudomonas turukhanskensis]
MCPAFKPSPDDQSETISSFEEESRYKGVLCAPITVSRKILDSRLRGNDGEKGTNLRRPREGGDPESFVLRGGAHSTPYVVDNPFNTIRLNNAARCSSGGRPPLG